jgi:preprotein translocase subunit SecG
LGGGLLQGTSTASCLAVLPALKLTTSFCSQITMILIILVAGALGTTIPEGKSGSVRCKSSNGNDDMTHATYFMAVLTVVIALVFIVLFRPKYLRMEAERRERFIESADHKFDDDDDN